VPLAVVIAVIRRVQHRAIGMLFLRRRRYDLHGQSRGLERALHKVGPAEGIQVNQWNVLLLLLFGGGAAQGRVRGRRRNLRRHVVWWCGVEKIDLDT